MSVWAPAMDGNNIGKDHIAMIGDALIQSFPVGAFAYNHIDPLCGRASDMTVAFFVISKSRAIL